MSAELKPIEILFLWRLAVAGGGDFKKEIKPDLDAAVRKRLEAAGLIETEKRKAPSGKGTPLFVSLTENGWGWLGDHLVCDLKTSSTAGNAILQRLLARLKVYIGNSRISLGELMLATENTDAIASVGDGDDLSPEDQVIEAYLSASNRQHNIRVRLADLRRSLTAIPRTKLDATLLDMAAAGKLSLFRLDNPAEIRAEDREAVLRTPSGEDRHVVYLGGRGS